MNDDLSMPHQIEAIENLWIPLPDGIRLAARAWMPVGAARDPVPAILECVPYRKRDGTRAYDETLLPYFASHGYAVLRIDLRGAGDSEGLPDDEYTPAEQRDLLNAMDWVCRQPWCSGNIGMMGISWGGFNSLQVAAHRPPALKAIISACASDDRYNDDVHYMQGCMLHDNFAWASSMFAYLSQPPDPEIVGACWREMWLARLRHFRFPAHRWLTRQRRDAYWKQGSLREDYAAIACPVLAVGGWEDGYSNAIPRLAAHLQVPMIGWLGPWGHSYPQDGLPGPNAGFLQVARRWWDHWLKGIDTGLMREPRLWVWMNESYRPDPRAVERPGRWVAHRRWPCPEIVPRAFFLGRGKLLDRPAAPEALQVRSPQDCGTGALEWCSYGTGKRDYAGDQRADDGRSLCFDSPPLPARLEFFGAPVLVLDFAVDRPVAKIAVRLNDIWPDGASTRVTFTQYGLNHRTSQEHPEILEPGRRYRARIALNDVAHAFLPGHRLRVAISTAYWPQMWPAPEPVTLTVFTGESRLDLPVRPAMPEDGELQPFPPPIACPAGPGREVRAGRTERQVTHDIATGEARVDMIKDYGGYLYEEIDLVADSACHETYWVMPEDPLAARAEIAYHHELRHGDRVLRTETRSTLRVSADSFFVTARVDAYENGCRIYGADDSLEVPRDFM